MGAFDSGTWQGFYPYRMTCPTPLAGMKKPPGLAGSTMLGDINMNSLAAGVHQIMQAHAAAANGGRRSLDAQIKRVDNPAIATAR